MIFPVQQPQRPRQVSSIVDVLEMYSGMQMGGGSPPMQGAPPHMGAPQAFGGMYQELGGGQGQRRMVESMIASEWSKG